MPVNAKQLSENPAIIHMQFSEPFDGEADLTQANQLTQEIMNKVGGYVCRIEDVTALDLDFKKAVEGLSKSNPNIPGSMADPNVYGIMVGKKGDLSEFTAGAFSQEQYGGKQTQYFDDKNEAIAHALDHMDSKR